MPLNCRALPKGEGISHCYPSYWLYISSCSSAFFQLQHTPFLIHAFSFTATPGSLSFCLIAKLRCCFLTVSSSLCFCISFSCRDHSLILLISSLNSIFSLLPVALSCLHHCHCLSTGDELSFLPALKQTGDTFILLRYARRLRMIGEGSCTYFGNNSISPRNYISLLEQDETAS